MSTTLIIILIAIFLVAFFVLAISLTLLLKGRNIQSEIGDNENLRERGIKCVIKEMRELDDEAGASRDEDACPGGDCTTCSSPESN